MSWRSIFKFLAVLTDLFSRRSCESTADAELYGPPISLENASKAAAAAIAEARKNNWTNGPRRGRSQRHSCLLREDRQHVDRGAPSLRSASAFGGDLQARDEMVSGPGCQRRRRAQVFGPRRRDAAGGGIPIVMEGKIRRRHRAVWRYLRRKTRNAHKWAPTR